MTLSPASSSSGEGVEARYRQGVVEHAERFVWAKFVGQDVSHDWYHLHRVRLNALRIARSLQSGDEDLQMTASLSEGSSAVTEKPTAAALVGKQVDLLVVELAALLHDMCDRKYLPTGASTNPQSYTAQAVLSELWNSLPPPSQGAAVLSDADRETVERIVDCVSWSKDQERRRRREARREKRRAFRGQQVELTGGLKSIISEEAKEQRRREEEEEQADELFQQWEASCPELWCVSDADRLDAIGSIGILRCAAYSAIKDRPLHIFTSDDGTDDKARGESCLAHFDDKLLKIHGDRLYTPLERREAERRQEVMRSLTSHAQSEEDFALS